MRETITAKSIKRLKKLSKSKSCKTEWRKRDKLCKCLGVVRYIAGFVLWTKEKFVNMDRRTREKCHQEDHQTQKSRRYNKFRVISGEILYNEAAKSVANTENIDI